MSEVVEFLLARIAEAERDARSCMVVYPPPWGVIDRGHMASVQADAPDFHSVAQLQQEQLAPDARAADPWLGDRLLHVARHDPAFVLAECEAKRKIVALHESWPVLAETPLKFDDSESESFIFRASQKIVWLTNREYVARFGGEAPTTPVLLALAGVYADHPDFREEWRA